MILFKIFQKLVKQLFVTVFSLSILVLGPLRHFCNPRQQRWWQNQTKNKWIVHDKKSSRTASFAVVLGGKLICDVTRRAELMSLDKCIMACGWGCVKDSLESRQPITSRHDLQTHWVIDRRRRGVALIDNTLLFPAWLWRCKDDSSAQVKSRSLTNKNSLYIKGFNQPFADYSWYTLFSLIFTGT